MIGYVYLIEQLEPSISDAILSVEHFRSDLSTLHWPEEGAGLPMALKAISAEAYELTSY